MEQDPNFVIVTVAVVAVAVITIIAITVIRTGRDRNRVRDVINPPRTAARSTSSFDTVMSSGPVVDRVFDPMNHTYLGFVHDDSWQRRHDAAEAGSDYARNLDNYHHDHGSHDSGGYGSGSDSGGGGFCE